MSPDGRLLIWFDQESTMCLYETASGQIIHRFPEGLSAFGFAPSGWRVAKGCFAESSILIWDIPTLFRSGPPVRSPAILDAFWNDLSARDAQRAHRALWRLTTLPEADAYLALRLSAVRTLPRERLRTLIDDLGNDDFITRQKAEEGLILAREAAFEALTEARRKAKDVELRLRLERLLDRLKPRGADRLREARAVMVLEVRGTPEARQLLQRLAGGLPEARLTQEAKAALTRLTPPIRSDRPREDALPGLRRE
jgi:hypothetical protein